MTEDFSRPPASLLEGGLFPNTSAIALNDRLEAVPLGAEHFFAIEPQDSQRTQYGIEWRDLEWAAAEAMAAQPGCWAVLRGVEVLAIFGINPTFADLRGTVVQGVAWALFAEGIGRDHAALTRFAREHVIGKCPLTRLEAIVRCMDVEPYAEAPPCATPAELLELVTRREFASAQVRWAIDVGFTPVAVLRKFGAAGETHLLLERIL